MSKQVQWRRGSTNDHSTFTGADGEVTVDTDRKVPVVHDGSRAGGWSLGSPDAGEGASLVALEQGGTVQDAIAPNIAYLKATSAAVGVVARTQGYTTPGDGGGAEYIAVADGTYTDGVGGHSADGSFLQGVGMQWEYHSDGTIDARQFGAIADTDSTTAIQAALDYADTSGLSEVTLPSGKNFNISSPLTMATGTVLRGGPTVRASVGVTGGNNMASLTATASMTHMVYQDDFCGIFAVEFNGASLATIAIDSTDPSGIVIATVVDTCYIRNVSTGIKWGGVTYGVIQNTGFNTITQYGLDALASYSGTYYGGNQCYLNNNEWKGNVAQMRVEGIFILDADDFEGADDAAIEVAGTNVSQLTLYSCYAEGCETFLKLTASTARIEIVNGFFDGDSAATSVFIDMVTAPERVKITGARVQQFYKIFQGIVPTNAFIVDPATTFANYTDFGLYDMSLFNQSNSRGAKIHIKDEINYNGDLKTWTDATNWNCMVAQTHVMSLGGAATINPGLSAAKIIPGHTFTIQFDGNTTLNHHASTGNRFTLAKGASLTPASGVILQFKTVTGGRAVEIGDYSARL